jgi:hypothetical protein
VSRNDDANARADAAPRREATDPGESYAPEPDPAERFAATSTVSPVADRSARHQSEPWPAADPEGDDLPPADEGERAQLIAGIARLLREANLPDSARVAALTLIGWLARRRPQETAHACGVEEARRSEHRWRAARPKAR